MIWVHCRNKHWIALLFSSLLLLQCCSPICIILGGIGFLNGLGETLSEWETQPNRTGPTGKKYLAENKVGILDLSSLTTDMQSFPEIRAREIVAVSDKKSALLVMSRDAQYIILETFAYNGQNIAEKKVSSSLFLSHMKDYRLSPDWRYLAFNNPNTNEIYLIDILTDTETLLLNETQRERYGSSIINIVWISNEDLVVTIQNINGKCHFIKVNVHVSPVSSLYESATLVLDSFPPIYMEDKNRLIFLERCADQSCFSYYKMKILNCKNSLIFLEIDLPDFGPMPINEFCVSPDGEHIAFFLKEELVFFEIAGRNWKRMEHITRGDTVTNLAFLNNEELVYLRDARKGKQTKLEIMRMDTGEITKSFPVAKFSPFFIIQNRTKILCDFEAKANNNTTGT